MDDDLAHVGTGCCSRGGLALLDPLDATAERERDDLGELEDTCAHRV